MTPPTPLQHPTHTRRQEKHSRGRRASSLNASAGDLPPVQASVRRRSNDILVLGTLDLGVGRREDDLDMARVTLVGVDATVRTVCPAAGFL